MTRIGNSSPPAACVISIGFLRAHRLLRRRWVQKFGVVLARAGNISVPARVSGSPFTRQLAPDRHEHVRWRDHAGAVIGTRASGSISEDVNAG